MEVRAYAEFREYVAAHTPPGLEATVRVHPGVRPCRSPVNSPAAQAGRRASAYLWQELASIGSDPR